MAGATCSLRCSGKEQLWMISVENWNLLYTLCVKASRESASLVCLELLLRRRRGALIRQETLFCRFPKPPTYGKERGAGGMEEEDGMKYSSENGLTEELLPIGQPELMPGMKGV